MEANRDREWTRMYANTKRNRRWTQIYADGKPIRWLDLG
jgi:hypothetical protein